MYKFSRRGPSETFKYSKGHTLVLITETRMRVQEMTNGKTASTLILPASTLTAGLFFLSHSVREFTILDQVS